MPSFCVAALAMLSVVADASAAGKETVLYQFDANNDGVRPTNALLRDAKGNLYGTTLAGGRSET